MYATNKKKIFDDIVNKQCNDGQSHRPNVLCQKKMSHQNNISNCFHEELNLRTCYFKPVPLITYYLITLLK